LLNLEPSVGVEPTQRSFVATVLNSLSEGILARSCSM